MNDALEQFFVHIGIERGLSPATLEAYERDLCKYRDWLYDQKPPIKDLDKISASLIEKFLASQDHLSPSSQARLVASIHEFHRFIFQQGITRTDSSQTVKAGKIPQKLPDVLSIDEVQRLIEAASLGEGNDPISLRDRALLEFLYGTGARVSEAVGLQLNDIHYDEKIVLLHGKGDKMRYVPLGSYACEAMKKYLNNGRDILMKRSKGDYELNTIFLNKRGKKLSRQSAWEIIQVSAQRAGLQKDVHPHTLRHCFATHLLQGGADIRTVQELLGHASVTTSQIYTHISPITLMETYAASHPRAR